MLGGRGCSQSLTAAGQGGPLYTALRGPGPAWTRTLPLPARVCSGPGGGTGALGQLSYLRSGPAGNLCPSLGASWLRSPGRCSEDPRGPREVTHTHTPLSCHSPLEQVQEGGFAHVVSASCHVKRLRATSPAGRSPGSPQVISIPTPVCQKFALSPCSIPPSLTLSSHL